MLLVCCSSSHYQISCHAGIRALSPLGNAICIRGIVEDRVAFGLTDRVHSHNVSFKTQATKFLYSPSLKGQKYQAVMEFNHIVPCRDELDHIECLFSNNWSDSVETAMEPYFQGSSQKMSQEDVLFNISDHFHANISPRTPIPGTILTVDARENVAPHNLTLVSEALGNDSLTNLKTSIEGLLSAISSTIDASVGKGDLYLKNSLDSVTSPLTYTFQSVREAIDNIVDSLLSTVDRSIEVAGNRLTGFSVDLKDSTSKVGVVSIDLLRRVIVSLEDSLASGASLFLDYYGSAKEFFPPEVRDVLNLTENKATEFLGPVATAFKQVYVAIEALETNLGLDPNDPVVPLFFILGTSITLGISYWVLAYAGYAGDLSPQLTLELLTGEKNVDLRERDGVPDLRQGARFKYASIDLPELDGSIRKLVKRERDLNDALVATVIRNLKIVQDRSKVIVLDANGTRSKSIARSLRKLGVKAKTIPGTRWLRSWVKNGLRIKELKSETTFTVLNEEAEAILEDIRPTPLQIVGYGAGFLAASYALSEWEKTLQLVGVIGLGQTIYRRIASYEDSEDFKQDVRTLLLVPNLNLFCFQDHSSAVFTKFWMLTNAILCALERVLLTPVRVGATTAFSWAAGKLEPNKIGLPTSPSSSDVQSRVLQAAAKHESQPSDSEGVEESSSELVNAGNEKQDP
ncbi:hypothetical protein IFM89_034901 [Coptis chinensis]|uniref:Rhodanese domain-containing protein n=1 Tax=Coptis chinensis TaxID=261450 RepID=A0A835I839_9MAGN|nr:hypothetical protein IFM89_034901 [Coptis chinensis]